MKLDSLTRLIIRALNPIPPIPKIAIDEFVGFFKSLRNNPEPDGTAQPNTTPILGEIPSGSLTNLFSETTEKSLKVVTGPAFIFVPFNL